MCLNNNFFSEGKKCSAFFSWGRACGPTHQRTSSVKNCFFRLPASGNTCPGFFLLDQKKVKLYYGFRNEKETLSEKKKQLKAKETGRLNGRLPDRITLLFLGL
jgi:hypothetical protein